ncbi:UNVERIFIED_CONTAM: hypothetical protein K2H54_035149 [Gekko kuhli]
MAQLEFWSNVTTYPIEKQKLADCCKMLNRYVFLCLNITCYTQNQANILSCSSLPSGYCMFFILLTFWFLSTEVTQGHAPNLCRCSIIIVAEQFAAANKAGGEWVDIMACLWEIL